MYREASQISEWRKWGVRKEEVREKLAESSVVPLASRQLEHYSSHQDTVRVPFASYQEVFQIHCGHHLL